MEQAENTKDKKLVLQKEPIENADLYKPVFNKLMITQEECMKQSFVAPSNKFSGQIMVKFLVKFHRLVKFIFLSSQTTHSFVESKYTYFFYKKPVKRHSTESFLILL